MSIRCQEPVGLDRVLQKAVYFETAFNTWYRFSHSQDPLVHESQYEKNAHISPLFTHEKSFCFLSIHIEFFWTRSFTYSCENNPAQRHNKHFFEL